MNLLKTLGLAALVVGLAACKTTDPIDGTDTADTDKIATDRQILMDFFTRDGENVDAATCLADAAELLPAKWYAVKVAAAKKGEIDGPPLGTEGTDASVEASFDCLPKTNSAFLMASCAEETGNDEACMCQVFALEDNVGAKMLNRIADSMRDDVDFYAEVLPTLSDEQKAKAALAEAEAEACLTDPA